MPHLGPDNQRSFARWAPGVDVDVGVGLKIARQHEAGEWDMTRTSMATMASVTEHGEDRSRCWLWLELWLELWPDGALPRHDSLHAQSI